MFQHVVTYYGRERPVVGIDLFNVEFKVGAGKKISRLIRHGCGGVSVSQVVFQNFLGGKMEYRMPEASGVLRVPKPEQTVPLEGTAGWAQRVNPWGAAGILEVTLERADRAASFGERAQPLQHIAYFSNSAWKKLVDNAHQYVPRLNGFALALDGAFHKLGI